MKWICKVCGYIHEGSEPPAICPVCKVGRERFEKMPDAWESAEKHVVGSARGVDPQLAEGLAAAFQELSRQAIVQLAMGRAAEREGLPEVGAAHTRIALEQAEHAARLAEMLGEGLSAVAQDNLSAALDTQQQGLHSLQSLAGAAQKKGYAPLQDSLQEMARDAARHGRMLAGMLSRYFNR